jgi:prepilin-type N-terminal cleavage/methylation domain-containing protein
MTSHTRHPMKHQRGFSIIELAVTLVVLGILLTSALPNITSCRPTPSRPACSKHAMRPSSATAP